MCRTLLLLPACQKWQLCFSLVHKCPDLCMCEVGFPHSSVSKKSACSARDLGSIPGSGTSPGEGNGNPFQYSFLENPMDRGACHAADHGVTRVRHDLATKPPPEFLYILLLKVFPDTSTTVKDAMSQVPACLNGAWSLLLRTVWVLVY